MLKPKEIARLKSLRRRGYSIPEISERCLVARSTVLRHVQDVHLTPVAKERLLERRRSSSRAAATRSLLDESAAKKFMPGITKRELKLLVISLYWAEGAKKDFSFCNTDPRMVRVFVNGLRYGFGVKDEDVKISIRIYEDLDVSTCLSFWSGITGIDLGTETKIDVLRGKKNGKLRYGMCRLRIKNGGRLLNEWKWVINRIESLVSPRSSMDRTLAS